MVKVLVTDALSEKGLDILREDKNYKVDVKLKLSEEELLKTIPEYDVLLIRSGTKATAKVIDAATNLKLIGRAGVGIDNVDVSTASKKGIVVMNTPLGNTISAAEHTISMLLSLSRNIPQANTSLKNGEWKRKEYTGTEVKDKILGIVGLGKIGTEVAKRAKAFDMKIFAYDPFLTKDSAETLGIEIGSLEDVLTKSDYITLHIPLNDDTKDLINKKTISKMKEGVRIINVARGGIINELDLADAIESGKVKGTAIDVFDKEPSTDSPLFKLNNNVVVTPHLGASTEEAQINVAIDICKQVKDFFGKDVVKNAINVVSATPEVMKKLSSFLVLIEKMGCLQAGLLAGCIKEVELEYVGDISSYDVTPLTMTFFKGLLKNVEEQVNFVNIPIIIKERGIKFKESKLSGDNSEYVNLITVKVTDDKGKILTLSGTVFSKNDCRIVKVDDFDIDAVPNGHLLICKNNDTPGVIGHLGTTLGEAGVNIANMQVGRAKSGGQALIVTNIDQIVSNEVLEKIGNIKDMIDVKMVEL